MKSLRKPTKTIFLFAVLLWIVHALFLDVAWGGDMFIYRDLDTGILSHADNFVTSRNMRHVWVTSDNILATIVQKAGHEGLGLTLYSSTNGGKNWAPGMEISDDFRLISDGIIDADNHLLVVYSSFLDGEENRAEVWFCRLAYDAVLKTWSLDHASNVFISPDVSYGSRATIAMDQNGVLWCAFRVEAMVSQVWYIKVYYSTDDGYSWHDCGEEFGTRNSSSQKTPKVIAFDSKIGLVYHDVEINGPEELRSKNWAYRDDSQTVDSPWHRQRIAHMESSVDIFGTHWSVAPDSLGNVHLAYQDAGINYVKYFAGPEQWGRPFKALNQGTYVNLSVSSTNNVYLFQDVSTPLGARLIGRKYTASTNSWSGWKLISLRFYAGNLRMCSPEAFDRYLPLLHQADVDLFDQEPFELVYHLIFSDN